MRKLSMTAVALGAIMTIAACESSGHTRYASVGTVGPQGAPGPAGPQGEQGEQGAPGVDGTDGAQGAAGEDGGNTTLGDTGMIATGGLVGPQGIAGTGLLANLGDPDSTVPAGGDAMTEAGLMVASSSEMVDGMVDGMDAPAELTSLTSALTDTTSNIGMALADSGANGDPLVDGLMESTSPLLTAGLGGGTVLGEDGSDSLLGISALSSEQDMGSLAEVGVGSGGTLINADLSTGTDTGLNVGDLATVDLGAATDGLGDLVDGSGLTDLVSLDGTGDAGLTGLVDGVTGALDDTALTGVTQPVEDALSGDGSTGSVLEPVVGGLLGALGGSN